MNSKIDRKKETTGRLLKERRHIKKEKERKEEKFIFHF